MFTPIEHAIPETGLTISSKCPFQKTRFSHLFSFSLNSLFTSSLSIFSVLCFPQSYSPLLSSLASLNIILPYFPCLSPPSCSLSLSFLLVFYLLFCIFFPLSSSMLSSSLQFFSQSIFSSFLYSVFILRLPIALLFSSLSYSQIFFSLSSFFPLYCSSFLSRSSLLSYLLPPLLSLLIFSLCSHRCSLLPTTTITTTTNIHILQALSRPQSCPTRPSPIPPSPTFIIYPHEKEPKYLPLSYVIIYVKIRIFPRKYFDLKLRIFSL